MMMSRGGGKQLTKSSLMHGPKGVGHATAAPRHAAPVKHPSHYRPVNRGDPLEERKDVGTVRKYFLKKLYEHNIVPSNYDIKKYCKKQNIKLTASEIASLRRTTVPLAQYRRLNKASPLQRIGVFRRGVWQLDFSFMTRSSTPEIVKKNSGVKGFVVACEIGTNRIFAEPLRDQYATTYLEFVQRLMKHSLVVIIETDKEGAFMSKTFQDGLKRLGIKHYFPQGPHKSWGAERAIGIIKERIGLLCKVRQTKVWIDHLPRVVHHLNSQPINKSTPVIRSGVDTHEKFMKAMDVRFGVKDATMLYNTASYDYFSFTPSERRKLFRHAVGSTVLLPAKIASGQEKRKSLFRKVSEAGSFSDKLCIVRAAYLRATQKDKLVPGRIFLIKQN